MERCIFSLRTAALERHHPAPDLPEAERKANTPTAVHGGASSMANFESIVDEVYEAAIVPERWPDVLGKICELSGAVSGEFQVLEGNSPPLWRATPLTRDVFSQFVAEGRWRNCERPAALLARDHCGFLCETDYMSPEQLDRDPVREVLAPLDLGWLTGTLIPMPTGELVSVSFQRRIARGRPSRSNIAVLDALRPHLARAGLIAARLRLERARSAVGGLDAIGLAAAVLRANGKLLVANALFERLPEVFIARAHGRLAISEPAADGLLGQFFEAPLQNSAGTVRSIPVRRTVGGEPLIVHLLPLIREAHVAFSSADILLVATPLSASAIVPSPQLLNALFDLSPSEAKLASALTGGKSLKQAASAMGIAFSTARSYLEGVFRKTGTHQQSQLVALLKSVPAIAPVR
jgi:DNA-binding CsgD family transcriptional regulator